MKARFSILWVIVSILGCSEYRIKEADWSDELPSKNYYVENYRQDPANTNVQTLDQYLTWVKRFYQGWEVYPTGWNKIARDLLEKTHDSTTASDIETKLSRLGMEISAEWAKDNSVRRINTRHVSVWGNALQKSVEHGETTEIINRVSEDVDDLIKRGISKDLITENRFYIEEDIFSEIK